jgi:hypothetical protein
VQVHLAFAGPGAYAVTWITNPLNDARLAAAADELPPTAAADTTGAADGEEPFLASAGPQPHLEAQQAVEAAAALAEQGDEEADGGAANKHGRKRRKRQRRACRHVVAAAGRSVVQYGLNPGDYTFTGAWNDSHIFCT